jgi:acyl-CoA synthetase (AMP-forming)/AMP-acid ligase II
VIKEFFELAEAEVVTQKEGMENQGKCGANYVPLSPLSFLQRAAMVYANRTSIIYDQGGVRFTWAETFERCTRVASSLVNRLKIRKGEVVSVLAPNVPALYETHFAVPMAGAVLNTINTRLDARNVATILAHSHAKLLLVDYQLLSLAKDALALLESPLVTPRLILIHDHDDGLAAAHVAGLCNQVGVVISGTYEELVRGGDPRFDPVKPTDEWESICLNYTSGTTSAPKGVLYSHRGAYLSSMSILLLWEMGREPVYLWTLPMFHCNGWTFPWAIAARGGTNVCIRNTSAEEIYLAISKHHVTHLCCAPIVFNILLDHPNPQLLHGRVHVLTGGAPPAPSILSKVEDMGFLVTHAYGLTEATGPALACEWKSEWDDAQLSPAQRGVLKGRQGVGVLSLDQVDVKNPVTMSGVPRDGQSMGEIMLRGSSIMKGYFHDPESTAEAFAGGWFHTGDVGVVHPDGYVEIKDRSKDVIISGGENISSVEVESVLYTHPLVAEVAVVAMPHPRWGETPCAFIKTKDNANSIIREEDIVSFCREKLPHYMVPKVVVFTDLPKTGTGKIQKNLLRERAKHLSIPTSTAAAPTGTPRKKVAASKQKNRPQYDNQDGQFNIALSRL